MALTLSQMRTMVRALLSEPTASYWSDSELNNYINYGLEEFSNATDVIEDISTDSLVQYQSDYTLPSDYTKIKRVEIVKGNSVYEAVPEDLEEHYQGTIKSTANPPNYGNIWEGKLRLRERPNTAAQSTTLSAAISSTTATSLTITSATGFPRMGRVLIDSEVIIYWAISGTTVSPCARGAEGTTAATHSNAATVTLRDIWIYHYQKHAALTSDTSSSYLPAQFDRAPIFYAAWIGRIKHKDYDLAESLKKQYDEYVVRASDWKIFKWKRGYVPK